MGNEKGPPALVLLVEDEPELLAGVEMVLEDAGFVVAGARDGARALGLLDTLTPDVIVSDIMMPVMDGFELLRRYRERGGRAPFIVMSAFDTYVEKARGLGADAALRKPFDPDELVDLVDKAVASAPLPAVSLRPPLLGGEPARLQHLVDLDLDKPAPEDELRAFLDDVASCFSVPVALLSVITADRQYWTAACRAWQRLSGGETGSIEREHSFCTHAVVARAALVVQDSIDNPFFKDNPLVRNRGLRFYAGVPLAVRHGEPVGTLCILDFEPHAFSHADLELLTVCAKVVVGALERREKRRTPAMPDATFCYLHYYDEELGVLGNAAFRDLAVVEDARQRERGEQLACVMLAVPTRRLHDVVTRLRAKPGPSLIGRMGHSRLGWLVPGASADDASNDASEIAGPHAFIEAAPLSGAPGAVPGVLAALEERLGDAGLL